MVLVALMRIEMNAPLTNKNSSRNPQPRAAVSAARAFTLTEVLVAMTLILFALVGIYTLQAQSLRIVQSAHDSSAASQVLQQRLEQLRLNSYDTVVTASGVIALMNGSVGATQSEQTMTAVRNFQESVKISRYVRPGVTTSSASGSFTVTRSGGSATSAGTATDLSAESAVKAQFVVVWSDRNGSHRREFSSVFSRGGVSRAGISKRSDTSSTPLASTP